MEKNKLKALVVDVVNNLLPKSETWREQEEIVFSQRIIITEFITYGGPAKDPRHRISYLNCDSFKKDYCYVPVDFEVIICNQQDTDMALADRNNNAAGLEAAFKKAMDDVCPKIQQNLREAAKLIRQAEALSDKSGIPFRSEVSLAGFKMSYIPPSISEKFSDLSYDVICDLTHAYGESNGWQSSQTC